MPKSRRRKPKIPLSARTEEALREQRKAFRGKFGRDWRPGDPVFFDPDADTPTPISTVKMQADMLEAMRKAGTAPEIVYAFKKTGLLLTESNKDHVPKSRRAEWNAAIEEYYVLEENRATKPAGWDTEIVELLVSGMTEEDLVHVHECLRAVGTVDGSMAMKLAGRIELAAYFVAGALDHAFESAHATGHADRSDDLFEMAAEVIIRRAQEIYARGPAPRTQIMIEVYSARELAHF